MIVSRIIKHTGLKIHIFIPLPGSFADTIFYADVSFFCFFLGLQMQFGLPSRYNYILNLLILELKDTFQRQKVSSILLFLDLKILFVDKWYLQTLKVLIADTFLQEFTEILIFNTMRITIADTLLQEFIEVLIFNTMRITIADTFLQEFTEILIFNTIKITIADTLLQEFIEVLIFNTMRINIADTVLK